jgi:hypothetical protein
MALFGEIIIAIIGPGDPRTRVRQYRLGHDVGDAERRLFAAH